MHRTIEPAILYFGTPVVLVTTENEDGGTNVAPISSAWWLGYSCMLGFGARSKTPANILRTESACRSAPARPTALELTTGGLARAAGSAS